jgi:hypothetical protein
MLQMGATGLEEEEEVEEFLRICIVINFPTVSD